MKPQELWQILLVTSSGWLGVALGSTAQTVPNWEGKSQSVDWILRDSPSTLNLPRISEIERPFTSAQRRVQLPAPTVLTPEVVLVTGVKANPTEKGVEVILQTLKGQQLQVVNRSTGNSYIADLPNAQLRLLSSKAFVFRSPKPIPGITEITVTNFDANTIRVTVTGEASVPTVELFNSPEQLIFSVARVADATPSQQPPQTQPTPEPVEPGSEIESDAPAADPEEEVVVTGEQETGYRVPSATTGTRTDTPILDIPASIQVIPRQVIEDQQVTRIDEALQNVPGVTFRGIDTETRGIDFSIRGFEDAPVLRDGFRTYVNQAFPEVTNLERIEVLKGPASILFGEIQPGGAINLVSKKPLSEPFYETELQVGNRGFVRPRFDFSGPLTADGSLLYRLNGLYQRGDSFRDYDQEVRRFFIGPTLTWKISPNTDLRVSLEYTDDKRPADFGLPAFGDGVVDVPRDRIPNEPDDTRTNEYLSVSYDFEHRFSENWKLQNAFRYSSNNYNFNVIAYPYDFDEATGTETRYFASLELQNQDYSLQTNVIGEFATGPINHTLLFGVDLNRSTGDRVAVGDFETPILLNIFNPVYRQLPKPDQDILPVVEDTEIEANRLGIYVQDQVSLFDNLKLLAGLRYDIVDQKTTSAQTIFNAVGGEQTQNNDAFSPRVGIVYQPIKELSLYASYSQSFNPNTETTASGDPLEPEKGEGYEVGVKAELLGGRLFGTLAYFDITKQNVAVADPNPTLAFDAFIATGEQKSRGVELDITGEILPGWNIIAAYAYIDAEVTNDTNPVFVGSKLPGIPKHSANLWTTYEVQSGNLQGLGFGLGFNFAGPREGGLPNSFEVDSYFITNAAIFYRRNNWRFRLNFKNLFDVNYIETAQNERIEGIYPGEPFTVLGSVSVEF